LGNSQKKPESQHVPSLSLKIAIQKKRKTKYLFEEHEHKNMSTTRTLPPPEQILITAFTHLVGSASYD